MSTVDKNDGGKIHCELCPHDCVITNGYFGACGVRGSKGAASSGAVNSVGIIPYYGFITALAVDPIEKKPLYHFMPDTQILSLGFSGCNLRCPFCQNWHISQIKTPADNPLSDSRKPSGKFMKPAEIISAALKNDTPSIAYTYSEPLVHIEYLLDCMTLARRHGIANVLVTNGCINAKPAAEVLTLTDAANVDLKCFSKETYKNCLGSGSDGLQTVLDFITLANKMGI
ncbi:MAG: radical SAM protein, partial [Treponema sp.]|nr:radical SAM protein [Treponema sp.]